MSTFRNLDDLLKAVKKNPLKYAIGQTMENMCPNCNKKTKIKVISQDKLKCLSCNTDMNVEDINWK
ncbi:hypothetical protein [Schinkia azotoformans]|uniref:hypothetical protein n=1 Tax=Schinkia azotoformans TaxID=1454 RepID=UPI002DB9EAB5|nr:hypothetical protein [Schinkia azotoformans]MEC1788629.1 hypothetical protein [Schinkia azotoformans]MED4419948.1 hypothetical protein [Schinkia azotoformans]